MRTQRHLRILTGKHYDRNLAPEADTLATATQSTTTIWVARSRSLHILQKSRQSARGPRCSLGARILLLLRQAERLSAGVFLFPPAHRHGHKYDDVNAFGQRAAETGETLIVRSERIPSVAVRSASQGK